MERRARTVDRALMLQEIAEEGWKECQQRLEFESAARRRAEKMMRELVRQLEGKQLPLPATRPVAKRLDTLRSDRLADIASVGQWTPATVTPAVTRENTTNGSSVSLP